MSRPPKCSKLLEVEEQENMDKISSLPDDLLGQILSLLPTKCAVSTSILSSRWRCLHMLTYCLSFDAPLNLPDITDITAKKKSFERFVNRVLFFDKVSPIKKFRLNLNDHMFHDSHLHAWISAAILKGVEQLHLFFPMSGQLNVLPHSLFSCQTLVELKIHSIQDFRVPDSIHLPSLKILYLGFINFVDSDSFDRLLSACPLMQILEIMSCRLPTDSDHHVRLSLGELKHFAVVGGKGRFEVDAPNLVYLWFHLDRYVALSLKNPDRLVTACLKFNFTDDFDSVQHAVALIKALYHVKELCLSSKAIEYLTRSEDDRLPSYPTLVKLSFGGCSYDAWKYIAYWLAISPRLLWGLFV